MQIDLRGLCPNCQTQRVVWGPFTVSTPADADRMEDEIDARGYALARCPRCDATEQVALFIDDRQTEPWLDADEAERRGGPGAGPLPPRPWRDT